MNLDLIFNWIACGFVVGLLARAIVPGRQRLGCLMTTSLGIVGSFAGGYLYSRMYSDSVAPFNLNGQNWYGWGVSILGAVLLLVVAIVITPDSEK